ncbi:MAG: FAD/NAD(P)-binding oxidoreductase [Sphaerochaetaceae bacterium]
MKNHYHYLIIGGGLTADAAVRGIREIDKENSIGIISREGDPPYIRSKLSKGLWKETSLDKIWCNTQELDVDILLSRQIIALNREAQTVQDEAGELYSYDKLLLATGGTRRHLPLNSDRIIYYRTLQDYRELKDLSVKNSSFLVIGGGFIGSEIAAALAMRGKEVTMVFPEQTIGERVFPQELAQYVTQYYRQKGVNVVSEDTIVTIDDSTPKLSLATQNGLSFTVDGVIAGIGIIPNTTLAENAGLKIDNGIVVNSFLETSDSQIYAAGDVAAFPSKVFGKYRRVEHEDNAIAMGRLAGGNMAGAHQSYEHTPMFYSDLFDLGYEAVGELDSSYKTFTDWIEPFKKGVIYYLQAEQIKGILLWNVWDRVKEATALLGKRGDNLSGRLP